MKPFAPLFLIALLGACAAPGELCRFDAYSTRLGQALRDLDDPQLSAAIAAARPGEPR